jgi:hypothetical protein
MESSLIERRLECTINLSQTEVFENIDEVILHKLRHNREGSCLSGMYVAKILKINCRSMATVRKDDPAGTCTVHVNYTALVVSHKRDDVLPLCKVLNIDSNNRILCTYKNHTLVWIKGALALSSLQPDQQIPVLVKSVGSSNANDKIIVSGVPYTYPNKFILYSMSYDAAAMSGEDQRAFNEKLNVLKIMHDALATVSATAKQTYCNIFYPLKRKHTLITLPEDVTTVQFQDAMSLKQGDIICRPMLFEKSQDCFLRFTNLNTVKDHEMFATDHKKFSYEAVVESPIRALDSLMNDYISYARLICELSEEFSTEEKFKSQSDIWRIYALLKF